MRLEGNLLTLKLKSSLLSGNRVGEEDDRKKSNIIYESFRRAITLTRALISS